MKRMFFTLCLAALMLLTACGGALNKSNLESSPYGESDLSGGVAMSTASSVVGPDTEMISLRIINETDKELTFGADYTLETLMDGEWYVVPPKEEMSFIMIAYILEANGTAQAEVALSGAYGKLPDGRYRVVKGFSSEDGNTAAAAVFEIAKG
jgi:hypothetical protein